LSPLIAAYTGTIVVNNVDTSISDILLRIIVVYIIPFAGIIAVGAVVYAGVLFMLSQGNPDKLATAKKALLYAVLAVILFAAAFGISKFIGNFFG
jgi:hypothetical protein